MKKQKKTCETCKYFEEFKYNHFITHCIVTPDKKSITDLKRIEKDQTACEKYKLKIEKK